MSKVPDGVAIEDYEGDSEWFKIGMSGSSDGMHWDSSGKPGVSLTGHEKRRKRIGWHYDSPQDMAQP
jgi:hypothetical protein